MNALHHTGYDKPHADTPASHSYSKTRHATPIEMPLPACPTRRQIQLDREAYPLPSLGSSED